MTALAGYGFFCKPKVLVAGMKDDSPMSTPDQLTRNVIRFVSQVYPWLSHPVCMDLLKMSDVSVKGYGR